MSEISTGQAANAVMASPNLSDRGCQIDPWCIEQTLESWNSWKCTRLPFLPGTQFKLFCCIWSGRCVWYDGMMVLAGNEAAGIQSIRRLWNWTAVSVVFCVKEAVAIRTNDVSWIQHAGDAPGVHARASWIRINTLEQDSTSEARETSVHARRRNATVWRNWDLWNINQQIAAAVPRKDRWSAGLGW